MLPAFPPTPPEDSHDWGIRGRSRNVQTGQYPVLALDAKPHDEHPNTPIPQPFPQEKSALAVLTTPLRRQRSLPPYYLESRVGKNKAKKSNALIQLRQPTVRRRRGAISEQGGLGGNIETGNRIQVESFMYNRGEAGNGYVTGVGNDTDMDVIMDEVVMETGQGPSLTEPAEHDDIFRKQKPSTKQQSRSTMGEETAPPQMTMQLAPTEIQSFVNSQPSALAQESSIHDRAVLQLLADLEITQTKSTYLPTVEASDFDRMTS